MAHRTRILLGLIATMAIVGGCDIAVRRETDVVNVRVIFTPDPSSFRETCTLGVA
jgi:hypothetical protein